MKAPDGFRSTMQGMSRPSRSQSSSVSGTLALPASARRCTTALVEPPSAALARIALAKAAGVRNCDSGRPSRTSSTMRLPATCASACRFASTAGIDAFCGRATPSASHKAAMVEAVPMVWQVPGERLMPRSAARNSSWLIWPADSSSANRQASLVPIGRPR